jgi:hypothetical protein
MFILLHSHHLLKLHYHTFQKSLLKALRLKPEVFTYYMENKTLSLLRHREVCYTQLGDARGETNTGVALLPVPP